MDFVRWNVVRSKCCTLLDPTRDPPASFRCSSGCTIDAHTSAARPMPFRFGIYCAEPRGMWCCRRRSTTKALVVSHSSSGARLTSINFSFSSSTAFIRSSDAFITATCAVRTWRTLTLHLKGTLRAHGCSRVLCVLKGTQGYSAYSRVLFVLKGDPASQADLRLAALVRRRQLGLERRLLTLC